MAKAARKAAPKTAAKSVEARTQKAPESAARAPVPPAEAAPAVTAPEPPAAAGGASPANFAFRWTAGADGTGVLAVGYGGPLAAREPASVRFGVRRQGTGAWNDTREVQLRRQPHGATAALEIPPGPPVEAVQLVVHAGDEWDNGGRAPLGYYEWRPGAGAQAIG